GGGHGHLAPPRLLAPSSSGPNRPSGGSRRSGGHPPRRVEGPGQPRASRRRARSPNSTPRALVAQCAPALASTLPLRRRSSPKTSPPTGGSATGPTTRGG